MSSESLPDRRALRASDADRDQVVDVLRDAAGDGRLTADELSDRVEAALTAQTYGELEPLVADLPAGRTGAALATAGRAAPALPPKEDVRLESRSSSIRRTGVWAVPRRMEVEVRSGSVLLDFTEASVPHSTLDLSVNVRSGNLTLVVPPGVVVDTDAVALRSGTVRDRTQVVPGAAVSLHIVVSGMLRSGNVTVRGPREGLWARISRQ